MRAGLSGWNTVCLPQGDVCPRFLLPCLLPAIDDEGRFPARLANLSPVWRESEVMRPSIRIPVVPEFSALLHKSAKFVQI
jgi:hypothetical protein